MAALVVPLSSRKALEVLTAGGKGAMLARLLRAGFPVPPGFVVTTHALQKALSIASSCLISSLRGPLSQSHAPLAPADWVEDVSLAEARRSCLAWTIPGPLRQAILAAYRDLGGPGTSVAVRSSLVGEDGASASFAGLLETVLDVDGEGALLDALRRVLASAYSERLWAYLSQTTLKKSVGPTPSHGADLLSGPPSEGPGCPTAFRCFPTLSLAIVVQRMVRPQISGVAFSVDPVTCRPGVVIEAVPGLGEALVQGHASPDRYRLDPRLRMVEAAPARPGRPLLDEARARDLGTIVHSLDRRTGFPQDVEWAYDGRLFYVLQSRPISSIVGRPVYSRRLVSDMAPGLVKPLVWSTKYLSMAENVFGRMFDALLGPTGADYSRLVARVHSRLYTDVSMLGELLSRLGLPVNFFDFVAREDRASWPRFRFRLRMVPAGLRLLRFFARQARVERQLGPFLVAHSRALEGFRSLDLSNRSPEELVRDLERLVSLHAEAQGTIVSVSMNMAVRGRILKRLISRAVPGVSVGDVIKGYARRESLATFEAMEELAAGLRRLDPSLVVRIAADESFDITSALSGDPEGPPVLAAFEAFMARYGYLSANGSDFSEVPWLESPRLVWRAVARLALNRAAPPRDLTEAHREESLRLVRSRLGPLKRMAFDRLLAATTRFVAWRERVSRLMTEDSFLMRRCVLALGERLVERGLLDGPSDIFFLERDELKRLVDGGGEAMAVRETIGVRKAELAADEALDPPEVLCGSGPVSSSPDRAQGLAFISGIGGSAGVRTGKARIVRDPARVSGELTRDDVLVVPFTDIGWMPLLSGVGAIVAEAGGQLSHTSIIAREFGIPAVVSVPGATRLIREGQTVTVDGTSGRVYLGDAGIGLS